MKKKYVLLAGLFSVLLISSCDYDDTEVWNSIKEVENRLDDIEQSIRKANSDIESIQKLVKALQENVAVKEVVKTNDGYIIKFTDGTDAAISNGKSAPVISIKKDTDNEYYWTSNEEWLLVDGQKVKASGTDGITPKVQINPETKEWEISTDNGKSWTSTGVAAVGDSFFKGVDTSNEGYVVITLNDGSEIRLSTTNQFNFQLVGMDNPHLFLAGTKQSFDVKSSAYHSYMINKPNGWTVSLDETAQKITIGAPAADIAGAETEGTIDFMMVTEDAKCYVFKYPVTVSDYILKKLTFEDEDYRNEPYTLNYCGKTISTWSDLIDSKQYNGELLYNNDGEYSWHDKNNTELGHYFAGPLWNGGHAVSNYVDMDLSHGDYNHQLAVYYKDPITGFGGHNGSKNFCVHNGYSMFPGSELPSIMFNDGTSRVIDHMWVTSTTYGMNAYKNGCYPASPIKQGEWVKIVATGFNDAMEETGKAEFFLANGPDQLVDQWTKWDLSSLGKVFMVNFTIESTDVGEYGLNQPAYFAYDDVAVRF